MSWVCRPRWGYPRGRTGSFLHRLRHRNAWAPASRKACLGTSSWARRCSPGDPGDLQVTRQAWTSGRVKTACTHTGMKQLAFLYFSQILPAPRVVYPFVLKYSGRVIQSGPTSRKLLMKFQVCVLSGRRPARATSFKLASYLSGAQS